MAKDKYVPNTKDGISRTTVNYPQGGPKASRVDADAKLVGPQKVAKTGKKAK